MSLGTMQRSFVGAWFVLGSLISWASQDSAPPAATPRCGVDLARVGQMQDILSNALILGLHRDEPRVADFLRAARVDCADGPELLRKSAVEFDIDEAALTAEVERFRHVNCTHGETEGSTPESRPGTGPVSEPAAAITVSAEAEPACSVDLTTPGMMKDIVSNAVMRGLKRPEADVRAFLKNAETRYATGQDLLRAAAIHFEVDEAQMALEVERFRHCNCEHDSIAGGRRMAPEDSRPEDRNGREGVVEFSAFARDVTLHVVLHELGHALIREFDLPVLGNEETMADAFATHYLTTHLPDRAVDVLRARTSSLMIEARENPREEWDVRGEHDNDARRAFQIAALAVAADPAKYDSVAQGVGMSEQDIQKARDYGAEIHRSWRRVLARLWMPDDVRSTETRVVCDPENKSFVQLGSVGLVAELESILTRFDWHSQITIHFAAGDGEAGWSRAKRTVTVHSEYLRRFFDQGKAAGF